MKLAVLLYKTLCSPKDDNQIRMINGIMPIGFTIKGSNKIPPAPHFMWIEDLEGLQAASEIASGVENAGMDWNVSDECVIVKYQGITGQHDITFKQLLESMYLGKSIWLINDIEYKILEYIPVLPNLTEFQFNQ